MSVTSIDGQDLFNELVQQSGICQNCFNQTHEVEEDWFPSYFRDSLRSMLQDEKFYADPQIVEKVYPPEKATKYPSSRNICDCGVFLPWTIMWSTEDPLSRKNLQRNALNLADRMDEMGLDFDRNEFLNTVLEKKSQPEYQNKDEKIFHDALEECVQTSLGPQRTDAEIADYEAETGDA